MQAATQPRHPRRTNTLSGMSARSASVWVSYTGEGGGEGRGRRGMQRLVIEKLDVIQDPASYLKRRSPIALKKDIVISGTIQIASCLERSPENLHFYVLQ